jgi:hypothetical protein
VCWDKEKIKILKNFEDFHCSVADPDPHGFASFGKLDQAPHETERLEALYGHFKALEGPNLEKSEW